MHYIISKHFYKLNKCPAPQINLAPPLRIYPTRVYDIDYTSHYIVDGLLHACASYTACLYANNNYDIQNSYSWEPPTLYSRCPLF